MTVYFIAPVGGGNIKIGHTESVRTRLSSLMIWSPVPLEVLAECPGDRVLEIILHRQFQDFRLHGEWFSPADAIKQMIERIKSGDFPAFPRAPDGYYVRWDLKRELRENGLSVPDLAAGLGMAASSITSNWCCGREPARVPPHMAPLVFEFFTSRGIDPKHSNWRPEQ